MNNENGLPSIGIVGSINMASAFPRTFDQQRSPGAYQLSVRKDGYSQGQLTAVQVPVTETIRVSIPMKVVGITQNIEIQGNVSPLQGDTVTLGRVVDAHSVQSLPLAPLRKSIPR